MNKYGGINDMPHCDKRVYGLWFQMLRRCYDTKQHEREKGTIQDAIKMVSFSEYTPAADVAPVRHGRWVDKPLIKSFKHTNIPVVECSACGIDFCDIINNHYFMYKYCPNCGCRMDGGDSDVAD